MTDKILVIAISPTEIKTTTIMKDPLILLRGVISKKFLLIKFLNKCKPKPSCQVTYIRKLRSQVN